jgi:DNA-binding transcriptional MocR family regulator
VFCAGFIGACLTALNSQKSNRHMIVRSSDGGVMSGIGVNSETAGEKAYRRLRGDIIVGRLAPSQKLRLEPLKAAYGISVSTLRELLNRLTSEGLVVAESSRGFEVAPVSADNFKELANLRLLLESHALQRSFALGDMDWEGASRRGPPQTSDAGKADPGWGSERARIAEALRLRISPGSAVGLRHSDAARRARGCV